MLSISPITSDICFKVPFQGTSWLMKYTYEGEQKIKVTLHWKGKNEDTYLGYISLEDFQKISQTFEALAQADERTKLAKMMDLLATQKNENEVLLGAAPGT